MPVASGIYIITNVRQRNPIFLENPNDEESIRGHYKPEDASERIQRQWHWRVIDLKNGLHSIQNVEYKRYAYSGSRASVNASVMGANEEQQWHIQAISGKGEYTIGAIDSPNFWMLPDKEKRTPVELFDIPNDRTCWWTFTDVDTGAPVKEDAAYGAYVFEMNLIPILPFSPLRLDLVILQPKSDDSISNASRTIAGVCSPLLLSRIPQADALCVSVVEFTSSGSDIFFQRSYDVGTFEELGNLRSQDVSWKGWGGVPSLPNIAMRSLRNNTIKVAILSLNVALLQHGGQAIIKLTNSLAEHNITLILIPIQSAWEDGFSDSVVLKELMEVSPMYRHLEKAGEFSEYVVNYTEMVALPKISEYPDLYIPHIIELIKGKDQNMRSAAVSALSQLAEYTELRDAIFRALPKIVGMFKGNSGEAEAAASALIELAEHVQFCDVINTKEKNGHTSLWWATFRGHDAVLRRLLAHESVDVNAKDKGGTTSLLLAATRGWDEGVRLLLAHPGVDVNAKNKLGLRPLDKAVFYRHYAVIGLLLSHPGMEVNVKDQSGRTPLDLAVYHRDEALLQLLLARPDIDINAKDKFGRTPLLSAASNGHPAIVRLLLDYPGVDVNSKNWFGSTPLLEAAKHGWDEVVSLLLAHPDVDVIAKDKYKHTALSLATSNGHNVTATLLGGKTRKMGWRAWLLRYLELV